MKNGLIIGHNGTKYWYLNGQLYTDLKLFQQMLKLKNF